MSKFSYKVRTSLREETPLQHESANLDVQKRGAREVEPPQLVSVTEAHQRKLQNEVSEDVLLQELMYALQGIPGNVLKLDAVTQDFKVDPNVFLSCGWRRKVLRLAELGWMYNELRHFCDKVNSSFLSGCMKKSLVVAVQDHLLKYYKQVAIIATQVQQQTVCHKMQSKQQSSSGEGEMTLRRLLVWAMEPRSHLKCLLTIVNACAEHHGGAMVSCVHGYMQHGNPTYRTIVGHLLVTVCKPLYEMLSCWMLDGVLEDPFREFFIVDNMEVEGDSNRLWHYKYTIQYNLVPCFISLAQAKKVLVTGKNVNFLLEVCQDNTLVKGHQDLRKVLEYTRVEELFLLDHDRNLLDVMDAAYIQTSQQVLDLLNGPPHMFMENLEALRRYLLLGQGDFIYHLMETIAPELQKPVPQLNQHILQRILQTAIYSTNAQFETTDVLQSLDVYLSKSSPGDTGWDIFHLTYYVKGPIRTIFGSTIDSYLKIFKTLWRTKRMEYVLSIIWKRLVTSAKMLRKLPELAPILQRLNLLTAEIIHLVCQLQYYMQFEVLECNWHKMICNLKHAGALDDVISAHKWFIDRLMEGLLLVDMHSQALSAELHAVYDLIMQLQILEEQLHTHSLAELQARENQTTQTAQKEEFVQWGSIALNRREFVDLYLPYAVRQLQVITKSYQNVVQKFLRLLASHPNENLQQLSVRLDFNDHYKHSYPMLSIYYTYKHRQLSQV